MSSNASGTRGRTADEDISGGFARGGWFNSRPKYVVSTTLSEATWAPSTILSADVPAAVAELKDGPGRELQVHGSARLAGTLLAAGLVDELRLVIAPVVLGQGRRLFDAPHDRPTAFELRAASTTPSGLAIHIYDKRGPAAFDVYVPARS